MVQRQRVIPARLGTPLLILPLLWLAYAIRLFFFGADTSENLALGADGDWTLALATLPPQTILNLLRYEIHPPLFYLLLHLWMAGVGKSFFAVKYVSLFFSLLSVALLYALGKRLGGAALGLVGAFLLAFSGLHLINTSTLRDAATTLGLGLLSLYLYVRLYTPSAGRWSWLLAALHGLTNALGLYTSYLFLGFLIPQGVHALSLRVGRPLWLFLGVAWSFSLLLFLPWLATVMGVWVGYAQQGGPILYQPSAPPLPTFLETLIRHLAASEFLEIAPVVLLLPYLFILAPGVALGTGFPGPATASSPGLRSSPMGLVWQGARGYTLDRHALSFLHWGLALTLLAVYGISIVARGVGNTTSPRYLILPLPFVLLGLGVCWLRLGRRSPVLAGATVALVVGFSLAGAYAYLYRPQLPLSLWNPAGAVRYLDQRVDAKDAVVFNALGQAGYYEALSTRPVPWHYLISDDIYLRRATPERGEAQVRQLLQERRAIWLLLYGGGSEEDLALVGRLNQWAFPAHQEWLSDTWVQAYTLPPQEQKHSRLGLSWAEGIILKEAAAPQQNYAGGTVPLTLVWQATQVPSRDYKVFVHLVDGTGRRWAQHDAPPQNGAAPTSRWEPGQEIADRHGLLLARDLPEGAYVLVVGLYSEAGRLPTADGRDAIPVANLTITKAAL